MMSLPYFAPLGDAALRFDTKGATATASLPDGLLAGKEGIAMSCWVTSTDDTSPEFPIVVVGNDAGGLAFGFTNRQPSVFLFTGPADGSSGLSWDISEHTVRPALPDRVWIYLAVSYTHEGAATFVVVGDGSPTVEHPLVNMNAIQGFRHATIATLGEGRGGWGTDQIRPYRGAITRLRLWRVPLSVDALVAARFDLPVVPSAGGQSGLAVDWRMTEGYGDVAFDYAAPPRDRLPSRLGTPPGNHLRFGEGTAAPTWTVANLPIPPHGMVRS